MLFQKQNQEELVLNYQLKKIVHMIELQIMDIESSLHYIQKKHTTSQLKEALSQIYNIFNETQPIFKHLKASFLHLSIKKLMNCFGVIFLILNQTIDKKKPTDCDFVVEQQEQLKNILQQQSKSRSSAHFVSEGKIVTVRPFGGIYLYNQNYQRHLNLNKEPKVKITADKNVINTMTKQEFRTSVMQELNDTSLSMPHPDQVMDLFTFKFKYGKESQLVTFHDQLQSIAKYFKDAQNDAFQFLNKTKDQNSKFTYNESFKDIMNQIKLEKEKKVREFNEKIKHAFRSMKRKTQKQMLQIESKLEEVQEIKNSYKPPVTATFSTQTTYNFQEQLKYLTRRLEDAEEKYQLMQDIKKKEIEQNALSQLALENQLSLKAREVVYLKLSLEQKSLVIGNLNKKIKILNDAQKKIKQRLLAESKEINSVQYEETLQELDNINKLTEKIEKEANDNIQNLDSIKKQKKVVKKIIIETKKNSLSTPKSQYAKRFTQQNQIMSGAVSNSLLSKWNLSEISENNEGDDFKSCSSASNVNNLLTSNMIKTNNKIQINIHSEARPSLDKKISSQSIKSALDVDQRSRKATREKKTSHFIELHRKESLISSIKQPENQSINEYSDFGDSDSSKQDLSEGFNPIDNLISEQEMKKLEKMYQKQIQKSKRRVNERKNSNRRSPSSFYQLSTESGKQRFMSNTFQPESKKTIGMRFSSNSGQNSLSFSVQKNSFRQSPYEVFKIEQHEDDLKQIDVGSSEGKKEQSQYVRALQEKIQALEKQLEKTPKNLIKICQKEVSITIEPEVIDKKSYRRIRQDKGTQNKYEKKIDKSVILQSRTNKVKFQMDAESEYSELKTQKYGDLKSKDNRGGGGIRNDIRMATQMLFRSPSHSKTNEFKVKNASQHIRRQENRQITNSIRVNTEKHTMEQKKDQDCILDQEAQLHQKISLAEDMTKTLMFEDQTNKQNHQSSIPNIINKAKSENIGKKVKTGKDFRSGGIERNNDDEHKEDQNQDHELIKTQQEKEEEKFVKQLALKCKNLKQFKAQLHTIHKAKCGENCSHLKKYIANFAKYRQEGKEKLKMHIQNLHHSIQNESVQFPLLKKKK